jgi:alpha-galactosidase
VRYYHLTAVPYLDEAAGPEILTPMPPETPRINGPKVFGVRPGSPFLFTIPATGVRPMSFSARDLPEGLILDSESGRITGVLPVEGEWVVTLGATNAKGSAERKLKIVSGSRIALTPPMGWNSWNCWGPKVTQERVLRAARAMVTTGLINHGWSYVNIDDGWQGVRGGEFRAIQPNAKFPDMKLLADEIHGMGLKIGIYSTPWLGTFAGHIGSYADNKEGTYWWIEAGEHSRNFRIGRAGQSTEVFRENKQRQKRFGEVSFVSNDVAQWVAWGMDYLKYDWYPDVPHTEEISGALASQRRDIVLSISNTASPDLAAEWARLTNAWRTSGDLEDTWSYVSEIGFSRERWAPYSGPGHWNDPDMLVVGVVGWGNPHPTRLTPDEQYTHVSLWCLLAAPLLLGCDLEKLDEFTLGLLTNDEVIEVNQDPLGKQATRVAGHWDREVYAKPLEDGAWAVGLFNRGAKAIKISVEWRDLKVSGKQRVRDLWRQKDRGAFEKGYEAEVAPHGVVMIRVTPE